MALTDAQPVDIVEAAAKAARNLANLPTHARNEALTAIYDALLSSKNDILDANAKDLAAASEVKGDEETSRSMLKRLDLRRPGKYEEMLKGILNVRELDDPGA